MTEKMLTLSKPANYLINQLVQYSLCLFVRYQSSKISEALLSVFYK